MLVYKKPRGPNAKHHGPNAKHGRPNVKHHNVNAVSGGIWAVFTWSITMRIKQTLSNPICVSLAGAG